MLTPRRKIILAIILPGIIAALIVTGFLHFRLYKSAIERWGPENRFLVHTLKDRLENEIETRLKILVAISKQPAFSTLPDIDLVDPLINGIPKHADSEKRQILESLKTGFGGFSVLFVLSPDGNHYISHPYSVQQNLKKFNLADRPYFIQARQSKRPALSDSFMGADGVPAVAIDVPVLNSKNEIVAHLGGVFHLDKLSELIAAKIIRPFDSGFIVDRTGCLIAHTDTRLLSGDKRNEFKSNPLVKNRDLKSTNNTLESVKKFINPEDHFTYLASSTLLDSGWFLVLLRKESSIIQAVRKEALAVSFLVFLMMSGLGVIGLLIVSSISKKWETAEEKLREANDNLEETVDIRTHELQLSKNRAEEQEATLNAIFNGISDAIMFADTNRRIVSANQSTTQIFGYTIDDLVGKEASILYESETDYKHQGHNRFNLSAKEKLRPYEISYRRKNGEVFIGETLGTIIKGTGGEPLGFIAVIRDISKRKQAEKDLQESEVKLLQAQKMESVGRLAGGVAHDFNNMLGVILGHTELAMKQTDSSKPLYSDLQEIRKAVERSTSLSRQLLAFARKQTVVPVILDLNETVTGMSKMLQRLIGENIILTWKPGKNLWPVKVDPSQIDQILANLCVNARDAITDSGNITFETLNTSFDQSHYTSRAGFVPGEYVLLTVSDNGYGMDTETQTKIFEPFFTTKKMGEGTGLGLSTVYGIVKQNKGFIYVYSEPGQGTTFKIYLPRYTGRMDKKLKRKRPEIVEGNETILVVEDEPALLEMTKRMLESVGYTVLATDTPSEAIELIKKPTLKIRLLLTDVIMPQMSGLELSTQLMSETPELKCLYMSGYTADVIAHHGILDKGIHFIQKPFSRKDLAAIVRKVLDN